MSAVFQEFHQWESAPALKLLLPQRDEYFRQSADATGNRVVKPTGKPMFPRSRPASSPNPSPGLAAPSLSEDQSA